MNDIYKKLNNKKLSNRAKVIAVIEEILQGKSLSSLLDPLLSSIDADSRGFVHELLLGTLRQWWALSRITESLVPRPISDPGVVAALHVGLYQLLYMHTAEHAAVHETVESLKELGKDYGTGLLNAVLRKVQKTPNKFAKKINKNHSLPNWLAKALKSNWPQYYDALGAALKQPAPVFLRVNERRCSIEHYGCLLDEHGIAHSLVALGYQNKQTIRLDQVQRITELPHFVDGWASVQDTHAQLTAHLLEPYIDGHSTVLDMCCAPGGKTAHLLEKFHMKHLYAVDHDADRLSRVYDNLHRLGLVDERLSIIEADGTAWQADGLLDVIVLDAPCTATGVLRRHPDIALLRQSEDVAKTQRLQREILENLWPQLADGGVLLYVTCSILKVENESQLVDFLSCHDDAMALSFKLDLAHQIPQQVGYQCLPIEADGGDGFYYALLKKSSRT